MTMDEYQQKALTTAKDDGVELMHRALGVASEAGEIAGKLNKWLRDYKGDITKLDKKALAAEIGDLLWFTATLSENIGFSLDEIAKMNLKKLADRKKRGVLTHAEGDNR